MLRFGKLLLWFLHFNSHEIFRQLTADFGRLPEEEPKKIPAFPGFPTRAIAFDYCFGVGCEPFESLAGHLPVPLPMP
jgi:hypothetical protein